MGEKLGTVVVAVGGTEVAIIDYYVEGRVVLALFCEKKIFVLILTQN